MPSQVQFIFTLLFVFAIYTASFLFPSYTLPKNVCHIVNSAYSVWVIQDTS